MVQVYTFLKNPSYLAIAKDARQKQTTVSALLRKFVEEKYGGGK